MPPGEQIFCGSPTSTTDMPVASALAGRVFVRIAARPSLARFELDISSVAKLSEFARFDFRQVWGGSDQIWLDIGQIWG